MSHSHTNPFLRPGLGSVASILQYRSGGDAKRAKNELDWAPQYADLPTILKHAWEWEKHLAKLS